MKKAPILFLLLFLVVITILGYMICLGLTETSVCQRGTLKYYILISKVIREFPIIQAVGQESYLFDNFYRDDYSNIIAVSYESLAKEEEIYERTQEYLKGKGYIHSNPHISTGYEGQKYYLWTERNTKTYLVLMLRREGSDIVYVGFEEVIEAKR